MSTPPTGNLPGWLETAIDRALGALRQTDADEIDIQLEMARGTNIAVSRTYTDELEERVRAIVPAADVRLFSTEIRGDNAAVELKLAPQRQRTMKASELADLVRRRAIGANATAILQIDPAPQTTRGTLEGPLTGRGH